MGRRIGAGIAVLLLLAMVAGTIVLLRVDAVRDTLEQTFETHAPRSDAAFELEINTIGLGLATLSYIDTGAASARDGVVEDTNDLERWLEVYEANASDDQEERWVSRLRGYIVSYSGLAQRLVNDSTAQQENFSTAVADISELASVLSGIAAEEGTRPGMAARILHMQQELAALESVLAQLVGGSNTNGTETIFGIERNLRRDIRTLVSLGASADPLAALRSSYRSVVMDSRKIVETQRGIESNLQRFLSTRDQIDHLLDEEVQTGSTSKLQRSRSSARSAADSIAWLLLLVAVAFLAGGVAIALAIIRSVRQPITALITGTEAIGAGELTHRVSVDSQDELGELAGHFNEMADLLMTAHVEAAYQEEALRETNDQLVTGLAWIEKRNEQIMSLTEMGELIQSCTDEREAHTVIARGMQKIAPDLSGSLHILEPSGTRLEVTEVWGTPSPGPTSFAPEECWGLRRGRLHRVTDREEGLPCSHTSADTHLCLPLTAQGESIGLLVLEGGALSTGESYEDTSLFATVSEHVALALATLRLRERLRHQSIRDPLTGLFNRRYLEETLDREISRAIREGLSLSVVMIDVDNFKSYNDTFGHGAGDEVLRHLGRFLKKHLRNEDICCRYGGEEFLLVLPHATASDARDRIDALREMFADTSVGEANDMGGLTFSAGVAGVATSVGSGALAIAAADQALYRAKAAGRNKVVLAGLHDSAEVQ